MEGYFPVCKYVEMTGIKKDTILHRANRGSVDCFKNNEGRWFIYYCDDRVEVPEGYITLQDYADKNGTNIKKVRYYIKKGYIKSDNVITKKMQLINSAIIKGRRICTYIKEDTPFYDIKYYHNKKAILEKMEEDRPGDHYLTAREWAVKEGIERYLVYNWIKYGHLKAVVCGCHYYIPDFYTTDDVKQSMFERRRNKQEWSQKMKQMA